MMQLWVNVEYKSQSELSYLPLNFLISPLFEYLRTRFVHAPSSISHTAVALMDSTIFYLGQQVHHLYIPVLVEEEKII